MSERLVESASGALRLRVTIETADLFAMTQADRDAFDAVRSALDRLGGAVIVTVDDPQPIIRIDETPAEERTTVRRASGRQGPVPCRHGCGESFTTKGIGRHEQACASDPDRAERLLAKAAAPIDLDQSTRTAAAVRRLELPDDPRDLARLAAAVRASGADPSRIGAVSAMFLQDALACGGDLYDFVNRTAERTITLARRELRLDDDDPTLHWLLAFVDAYRSAEAAA